jgi:hypothetical protein
LNNYIHSDRLSSAIRKLTNEGTTSTDSELSALSFFYLFQVLNDDEKRELKSYILDKGNWPIINLTENTILQKLVNARGGKDGVYGLFEKPGEVRINLQVNHFLELFHLLLLCLMIVDHRGPQRAKISGISSTMLCVHVCHEIYTRIRSSYIFCCGTELFA